MKDIVIGTESLAKSYRGKPAVQGLTMSVPRGSICGFLGRNGAGKTTTLKLLMGMIHPDKGDIKLFGESINSEESSIVARQRIAFVSEDKDLYPFMSVGQMIRFTRPFFPSWRRDLEEKYLDLLQLPLSKPIPKLSKGMRTQLMLLLALARGTELVIMDEPTSGLDPLITEVVLKAIAELAATDGTTFFLSSHQLSEVEQICDRVCLIDQGQLVIDGELDELKTQYKRILLVFDGEPPRQLADLLGVDHARVNGRTASLLSHAEIGSIADRARELGSRSVEVRPVTLKEIFLDHVRGE